MRACFQFPKRDCGRRLLTNDGDDGGGPASATDDGGDAANANAPRWSSAAWHPAAPSLPRPD